MTGANRRLLLHASPFVRKGNKLIAEVIGENLPSGTVRIIVPDTVVLSGQRNISFPEGSFTTVFEWTVEHVQPGTTPAVQITVTADPLIQIAICQIRP